MARRRASAVRAGGRVLAGTAVALVLIWPARALALPTSVFWDQDESEQFVIDGQRDVQSLIPYWDPNGQACVFPDGSGRFTTGYNPTLPVQHNPGSAKPVMKPPVGEVVWDRHGRFTGTTLSVPGPYKLSPGPGTDIPPDPRGTYNDNGTFTGCVFDKRGDLLAADLGQGQGAIPPADNGRIIEWFPPRYRTECILLGPTAGGVGPHHVDGTGGLRDPGTMALGPDGDVYVPEIGADTPTPAFGRVLRIDHTTLPRRPSDCNPVTLAPKHPVRRSIFIQGVPTYQPFPAGIAWNQRCACWGVTSTLGFPSIAFYDTSGRRLVVPVPIIDATANPYGIAFNGHGDAYVTNIAVSCLGNGGEIRVSLCGPVSYAGQLLMFSDHGSDYFGPTVIADNLNYPVSVTVCDPGDEARRCPTPAG